MEHKKMDSDSSHPSGDDSVARVGSEVPARPTSPAENARSVAYDRIDRILRLNLDDTDYATFSGYLDQLYGGPNLLEALRNLADAFHEGRATWAHSEAAGYVESLVSAAESAIALATKGTA